MSENSSNPQNKAKKPFWKMKNFVILVIIISLILSCGIGFTLGQNNGYADGYNAKTEEIRKIFVNTFSSFSSSASSIKQEVINSSSNSKEKPIIVKVGEELKVKVNPLLDKDVFTATIKGIDFKELNEVKTSYKTYKPDEGNKFVQVNFTITNNGDATIDHLYGGGFYLYDSKGRQFTQHSCIDNQLQKCIDYKKLVPGSPITGSLTFDVSSDAKDYTLGIPVLKEDNEKDYVGINFSKT